MVSLGIGLIICEMRISILPSWTVLSLRQNRSQQWKESLSDITWHGKWQPSNLREHSDVAWSTDERSGKNAHSLSAHRDQVLQLHRWWGTQAACTQGQQVSEVSRAESEASAINPFRTYQ